MSNNYQAEELNYTTVSTCDDCGSNQEGTMIHCTRVGCPILFICNSCANPTLFVRAKKLAQRVVTRTKNKFNWYMLPKAERKLRLKKKAEFRAKVAAIKARRASK